uniref:Uncharacterized protein n=1 Tax=Arundo donax TaxID=35708 RepID=A0A0A8Z7M3_ARUDO
MNCLKFSISLGVWKG